MAANSKAEGPRILVVDDESAARSALCELLREDGFAVRSAADGYKALGQLEDWAPDLLLTDVKMPGMDGITLMKKVKAQFGSVGVVVMTAFGSVENAVEAMQEGADDYLTKPVHFSELLMVVRRVLSHWSLRKENESLREALAAPPPSDSVHWIGQSKASRQLLALVHQVSDADASVLVVGERGTGKKLVAKMLHEGGSRVERPFVTLHCAGLDDAALEKELFGYETGAFPGATSRRDGLFHRADKGTLFVDEVDHLSAGMQLKLLLFLEERSFKTMGGEESTPVDIRLIAACGHDLQEDVASGRFREDLFYRLNIITLRAPALRQRREDIPALATHFLRQTCRKNRRPIRGFHDRALRILIHYEWPGNVSQLEHCVERAVVLCQGLEIEPRHLPREILTNEHEPTDRPEIPGASMAELEKYAILKTLEHVRGSTHKAAEILGISPRKIQYRLAEYRDAEPSGAPATVNHSAPALMENESSPPPR